MFEHAYSQNSVGVYLLSQIDGTVQETNITAQGEITAIETQSTSVTARW